MNNNNMKLRTATHHFAGPAQYHHGGATDTVTIPGIKGIPNVDCVKMWTTGLIVEPTAVAGPVVSYVVRGMANGHAHAIISKNGKGAVAVKVAANVFRVNTGAGDGTITGGSAANGGVQTATVGALLADNQGLVLANDTNISGLTIYVTVTGY